MRFLLALILLCMTACSSVPTIRQTLPGFQGKNIDFAINWLGVPDRQYDIDGRTIYEWDNSYAHSYQRPRANMGFGLGSGGGYGVGVGFPLGGYETETYRQSCNIKLVTQKRIVTNYEFDGDDNGCAKYAKRLKPLVNPSKL